MDVDGNAERPRGMTSSVWLATGFGIGLVAPAPGTIGALLGVPWAWGVLVCPAPIWGWVSVVIGLAIGPALCGRAARQLGRKDPGPVVWDEIASVPLVFALTPEASAPGWLAVGFALHRVFDITKPWPCHLLEKLPGGLGIMADDVGAAGYGAIVMWTAWRIVGGG